MSGFRDRYAEFEAAGAQVLGLSADTAPSLKKYAEELGLQFPLLSDFLNRDLIVNKLKIFNERFGTARRRTYIIDKSGTIRDIIIDDKDMQAHSIRALDAVKALG